MSKSSPGKWHIPAFSLRNISGHGSALSPLGAPGEAQNQNKLGKSRERKWGNASTPGKTSGVSNFGAILSLFLRGLLPFGCSHPELWNIGNGAFRPEAALDELLDAAWDVLEELPLREQIPALELTRVPGAVCQENVPVSLFQGCYPQVTQAPLGAAWESLVRRLREPLRGHQGQSPAGLGAREHQQCPAPNLPGTAGEGTHNYGMLPQEAAAVPTPPGAGFPPAQPAGCAAADDRGVSEVTLSWGFSVLAAPAGAAALEVAAGAGRVPFRVLGGWRCGVNA